MRKFLVGIVSAAAISLIASIPYSTRLAAAATCPIVQSGPAFTAGGSVFGRIASQWNTYFTTKADANNGVLCNPTIIGGSVAGAFTINSGLTNAIGVRNSGSNTMSSGGTTSLQLFPVQKTSSYVVNSDLGGISDSGAILISHGSNITFTMPNPISGTIGTSYKIGSDGVFGYHLITAGGTALFYGCPGPGAGATSYTFDAGTTVTVISDGTNYNCTKTESNNVCGSNTIALITCDQTWALAQRGDFLNVTRSGSAFPIDMNTAQHFVIALNHSACPCTISNPTNVAAGQVGMIEIDQSSTGNDGVIWGTDWKFSNGNSPTLSTGASAEDFLSYYVKDATHIIVAVGVLNAQ